MFIQFGWGFDVPADKLVYTVSSFNVSIEPREDSQALFGNLCSGQIGLSLEITPEIDKMPAVDILKFAKDQHATAKTNGGGKIVVRTGENTTDAVQTITFRYAYITDITSSVSTTDDKFLVHMTVAAGEITISGVTFMDNKTVKLVGGQVGKQA